jgi:urease subunit alpha
MRPMFGAFGGAVGATSIAFVSQRAVEEGRLRDLGLAKHVVAVRKCRGIGKRDMVHNSALPKIEVDPETYQVRADGILLRCEPATKLALARLFHLF